jgi:histidinol-phosphate aminotransferase
VVRFRASLARIPDYTPGRDADVVARERGLERAIKLASNEVPYPPPSSVQQAVALAAERLHRYPDDGGLALRARLAARLGVELDHVILGAGSVALCQQAVLATADPGDEVLWGWPSFEAYPIIAHQAAATIVAVPLRDHRYALDDMADAISERTRTVFVCTPNNPTGTVVTARELEAFLARVPDDVLVVLDEAYHEFVRDDAVPDGIEVVRTRPNVLVLRTFSKAFGLAGVRVGYGIASPEVVSALRRTRHPFGVSAIAQAAALAALDAEAELTERVDAVVNERARVGDALRGLGLDVPESQGNFVWLALGDDAAAFGVACEERGVVLRPFPGFGVRVTIGTSDENDVMLATVTEVLDVLALEKAG